MTGGPTLLQMVQGYVLAPIIHTAARLGIADHLAGGPKTSGAGRGDRHVAHVG